MKNSSLPLALVLYICLYVETSNALKNSVFPLKTGGPSTNITVAVGSTLTLTCVTPDRSVGRVVWYKNPEKSYVAYISNHNNQCMVLKVQRPAMTMTNPTCMDNRYSVTFSHVQPIHTGWWYCRSNHATSGKIFIKAVGRRVSTETRTLTFHAQEDDRMEVTVDPTKEPESTSILGVTFGRHIPTVHGTSTRTSFGMWNSFSQTDANTASPEVRQTGCDATSGILAIVGWIGVSLLVISIIVSCIVMRRRKSENVKGTRSDDLYITAVRERSREAYSSLQSDRLDAVHVYTEISGSTGRIQSSERMYSNISPRSTETTL